MAFEVAILGLGFLIWRISCVLFGVRVSNWGFGFLILAFGFPVVVDGGCAGSINGGTGECGQRSATIHVFLTCKRQFVSLFSPPTGDDHLRR
ncbi:hypothetical protein VIGAN_09142500 [Vigna angularis var. angularis]|uniref:Uncharacterized protein n=1 Tax=Vigna angularis var. angularis TaxID=157739 RepID=A0A0S3SYK1_PHAAN|nr:hypothetical protein VIGAN_09142500 [Vigna angularis var. angularis]